MSPQEINTTFTLIKTDRRIQLTDELLKLHRFGESPFSDLPIRITIGNWKNSQAKPYPDLDRIVDHIHVQWNAKNVSYYQSFSNAQVVAKQLFIFVLKLIDSRIVNENQISNSYRTYRSDPISIIGKELGGNIALNAAIEYDEFISDKE